MKFVGLAPIQHAPPAGARAAGGEAETFARVVSTAQRLEDLGFDGFGVGERHHWPYLASSPPVVLSYIAARTSTIALFTGVTLLSALDPVRVAEDYATLDHLSGGRVELVIGKGAGPKQAELFGLRPDEQRIALNEKYRLLRRLWTEDEVSWQGVYRPPLDRVTTLPRPRQPPPRIWHGSSSSTDSIDLAAEFGDPIMFSNASQPTIQSQWLADEYVARWKKYGRDPNELYTGAGTPAFYTAPTSQQAVEDFRPVYDGRQKLRRQAGLPPEHPDVESFIANTPALVGSPQQIIEKVHEQHEVLRHSLLCFSVEPEGLTPQQQDRSFGLFQSAIAPELRRSIPDPAWRP